MGAGLPPGANFYFADHTDEAEQGLLDDLTIEAIAQYGIDMYYLPRTLVGYDPIYGEDAISQYNSALPIELYVKSVDGFAGEGVLFSKFGLEIRDQVTFTVSKTRFKEEIETETGIPRPNEGDLIYFPLNKKLFQIRYVDYKPFFYQLGDNYTYDLVCELYEYSSEEFNTGIEEIDEIQTKQSLDILDYSILTEDGFLLTTENDNYLVLGPYTLPPISDNDDIQDEQEGDTTITSDDIINWEEVDPFSESGRY